MPHHIWAQVAVTTHDHESAQSLKSSITTRNTGKAGIRFRSAVKYHKLVRSDLRYYRRHLERGGHYVHVPQPQASSDHVLKQVVTSLALRPLPPSDPTAELLGWLAGLRRAVKIMTTRHSPSSFHHPYRKVGESSEPE